MAHDLAKQMQTLALDIDRTGRIMVTEARKKLASGDSGGPREAGPSDEMEKLKAQLVIVENGYREAARYILNYGRADHTDWKARAQRILDTAPGGCTPWLSELLALRAELARAGTSEPSERERALTAALQNLISAHDGYRHGVGPCICAAPIAEGELQYRVNEWQRIWRTEIPEEAVVQLQELIGPWPLSAEPKLVWPTQEMLKAAEFDHVAALESATRHDAEIEEIRDRWRTPDGKRRLVDIGYGHEDIGKLLVIADLLRAELARAPNGWEQAAKVCEEAQAEMKGTRWSGAAACIRALRARADAERREPAP